MASGSQFNLNFPGYNDLGFSSVENITGLRNLISLNIADRDIAVVQGGQTSGDGQGGMFVYRANATGNDDGLTTILPVDLGANGPGRWLLLTIAGTSTKSLTLMEVTGSVIPTPAAGHQTVFIDVADHKLKRKDANGTITVIG